MRPGPGTDVTSHLWSLAGAEPESLDRVTTTGPRHALPAVFDVTGLAAGTVAAAQLAAAELRPGGSARHPVAVDRRHAAIAFRSERLFTVDGRPGPSAWDAASGHYWTADDRLVQFHCNYPHHRAGVLAGLGVSDPGDDRVRSVIEAAVAERDAHDLEDRLSAEGMCVALLRSPEEWSGHPQGQAVGGLPVLEIERVADSAPEPLPSGPAALDGVRVADLTRVIAGPVCGRVLAAHGADVLRIGGPDLPVVDALLPDTNLGKRWADVDLASESGRTALIGLVAAGDVVVQGYRPGSLARRGFDMDHLVDARPGLVYATLSAYSHAGPWSDRRGFDSLVQTASGIGAAGAAACGVHGTKPLPAQALDHGAGWLLAFGVMIALGRRADEGGAWRVRTSLAQVSAFLQSMGHVDAMGVADPARDDVADLMTETAGGASTIGHVALPGTLAGEHVGWRRAGSARAADDLVWSSAR